MGGISFCEISEGNPLQKRWRVKSQKMDESSVFSCANLTAFRILNLSLNLSLNLCLNLRIIRILIRSVNLSLIRILILSLNLSLIVTRNVNLSLIRSLNLSLMRSLNFSLMRILNFSLMRSLNLSLMRILNLSLIRVPNLSLIRVLIRSMNITCERYPLPLTSSGKGGVKFASLDYAHGDLGSTFMFLLRAGYALSVTLTFYVGLTPVFNFGFYPSNAHTQVCS